MNFFRALERRFHAASLQNKMVLSMLAGILFISVTIALIARWILVSSLTEELERRGKSIAHSIAERGGAYILDDNIPQLLALIFDEVRLQERRNLISYIFVEDQTGAILAHTMTRRLSKSLLLHQLDETRQESVRLVQVGNSSVYDIAVPINEGLYRIGSVHVGLSKTHIDSLVSKLRVAFLGFISGVVLIAFYLSHRLSRSITRPIHDLTVLADEISRGNFDAPVKAVGEGWDTQQCPAYQDTDLPCWHFDRSSEKEVVHMPEEHRNCGQCVFYHKQDGDEVVQLADSFRNMVWSIRLYRHRLRESEEKYRSLFDSGPDPILVVDYATGTIMDANPRTEELYGYSRAELVGKVFWDIASEEDCNYLEKLDGESGCVYFPKTIHYRNGGEPFFVNMHACIISYRGRHALIVAVTDITEMIEKDAQLIQAGKMKSLGEMSAGIAHELNQPLNAIKIGSEYLLMMAENGTPVPLDKQREVVLEISEQVDRVSGIISTMRSFGRKADLGREQVDLNSCVHAVLSLLRQQFELDAIRFSLELGEQCFVFAQSNRLQQVFLNLLTNARDAINDACSPMGGEAERRITIRTGQKGSFVFMEVMDTGHGIPLHVQSKVFEPFYTTKEAGQGMGLGLAISYGIVKDYAGTMHIESAPGAGTCFRLEFPACEQDISHK